MNLSRFSMRVKIIPLILQLCCIPFLFIYKGTEYYQIPFLLMWMFTVITCAIPYQYTVDRYFKIHNKSKERVDALIESIKKNQV